MQESEAEQECKPHFELCYEDLKEFAQTSHKAKDTAMASNKKAFPITQEGFNL